MTEDWLRGRRGLKHYENQPELTMPNQKGMTLIEVIIGMGVITVALLAILGSNITVRQHNATAFEHTRVYQDMHRVIEDMRNAANVGGTNFHSAAMTAAQSSILSSISLPTANNEVLSVTYGAGAGTDMRIPLDVTITATWLERGIRPVSKTIHTFVMQRR